MSALKWLILLLLLARNSNIDAQVIGHIEEGKKELNYQKANSENLIIKQ